MRITAPAPFRSGSRCSTIPQFGNGSYGSGNGVIVNGYPGGDSDYSSLQTKVQKRLTHHLTTLATLHLGQADDRRRQSAARFRRLARRRATGHPRTCRLEHSVSPQDVKYQFTGEVSYDLARRQGPCRQSEWSRQRRTRRMDRQYHRLSQHRDPHPRAGSGTPIGYFNQRADSLCNPGSGAPHTAATWFNYNCFTPREFLPAVSTSPSRIRLCPATRLLTWITYAPPARAMSTCRSTSNSRSARSEILRFETSLQPLQSARNSACQEHQHGNVTADSADPTPSRSATSSARLPQR